MYLHSPSVYDLEPVKLSPYFTVYFIINLPCLTHSPLKFLYLFLVFSFYVPVQFSLT
jgi:hypothetical protein